MAATSAYPVVIAMKGHPGSGKTTLARSIAAALHLPLLDKDDIRNSTLKLEPLLSSPLLNDLSYEVLWRITETQIKLGLSLIVDSPLSRKIHLDRLLQAAGGTARVVVVECRSSDEREWRRRLEERAGEWHKPGSWTELQALVESYGGCTDYDLGDVKRLVVDTTDKEVRMEERVSDVITFIHNSCI